MSTPEAPPPGGPGGYPPQQPPTQPVGQPGYGTPPAQYPQPGAQQAGPGFQERASQAAEAVGRHVKTPETKEFFKTSEFAVWALTVLALLIAGAVTGDNGGGDTFQASTVWTLVTVASFAYIVSRGISKAGTRRGYGDAPMDRG